MLSASLLANADILPQARQGSYFFNKIRRKQSVKELHTCIRLVLALLKPCQDCRSIIKLTNSYSAQRLFTFRIVGIQACT
ncbi:hypothetical protein PMI29_00471 [Pseudomonas sp. GM49]|nr:hypothetical protein PMI29_00471 [Pseudomonas sp. GM49]